MIGNKIMLAVIFATTVCQAGAQEFGVELSGGLQGVQYPLKYGQTKLLPGGSVGLNHVFRLNDQLGLLTGVTEVCKGPRLR